MRRTASFTLIVLLLLQSGGLFLVYKAMQCLAHYEMMQTISHQKTGFTKLTISREDYRQGKVGFNEFFFHGELFDVKSVSVHGSEISLLVLPDSKEKSILKKAGALGDRSDHNHALPVLIAKLLMLTYVFPAMNQGSFLGSPAADRFIHYSEFLRSPNAEIATPPPRCS